MKKALKTLLRIAVFLTAFLVLFSAVSNLFQPVWLDWNNFNTMYGFYEEPKNTIDTVFLGSSVVVSGVLPMQLYEEHGICAYNFGTEQQPVRGSYTLLEETYRLHKETLQTVFLEVSAMRAGTTDSFYRKILDAMPLSLVKIRAVMDYKNNDLNEAMNYLVPFVSYHTRWDELKAADYKKTSYEKVNGNRGYMLLPTAVADLDSFDQADGMDTALNTKTKDYAFDDEAIMYLDRIVSFCKDKGLNLVLFRAPSTNWSSTHHNAFTKLLEEKQYDVEFYDFNFDPMAQEISYLHQLDSGDNTHVNYFGAQKLTDWIGQYLVEKCGAVDVRGDKRFSFMEEQQKLWHENTVDVTGLMTTTDVAEYIDIAFRKGYAVLISAKGDTSLALTEEQRARFAEKGLTKLAAIGENEAYLAVVEDGQVLVEKTHEDAAASASKKPLTYDGKMSHGKTFSLKSGGYDSGDISSIVINKKEQSRNQDGLNIAVYYVTGNILQDTTFFDTTKGTLRDVYTADSVRMVMEAETGAFPEGSFNDRLQAYVKPPVEEAEEEAAENVTIGDADLFKLLKQYWSDEDKMILFAAQNEASANLKTAHRELLAEYGLAQLAEIGYRDAYIAIVDGGKVTLEKKDSDTQYIEHTEGDFSFISAGFDSGNTSSIMVKGKEYSQKKRGLNVVVYSKADGKVEFAGRFDTNGVRMLIP